MSGWGSFYSLLNISGRTCPNGCVDVTTKALNTGINFVANIKLNNTGRAIQVFWSHFDLSVENGLRSHWFCFTAHSDWCRKVALTCFSTNQMCFPALEVPLPASSDWPIRLITLVSLYDVQPKSALVFMIKSSNSNSIKVSHFLHYLKMPQDVKNTFSSSSRARSIVTKPMSFPIVC